MSDPALRAATYRDLFDLPEHVVGEILAGEIHVTPRPKVAHGIAWARLGARVGPPFDFGEGGPGGWWILDEPEVHLYDVGRQVARVGEHAVLQQLHGLEHVVRVGVRELQERGEDPGGRMARVEVGRDDPGVGILDLLPGAMVTESAGAPSPGPPGHPLPLWWRGRNVPSTIVLPSPPPEGRGAGGEGDIRSWPKR